MHNNIMSLQKERIKNLRYLYILIENILHDCDWNASSGNNINMFPEYGTNVFNYLNQRPGFKRFNELQNFLYDNGSGSFIIQSPTGSGKTEASILWSQKNKGKLLYLLPTMNTANKIYDRLCKIFSDNSIGLLHSTSDLFLTDSDSNNYNQNEFSKFYSKTFNMPVMVATVDQLLYSMYNINRWDSIMFNSFISNIVFDEIHAYDPKTIALIIKLINNISIFNPNILIMSATIPDALKDFIKKKSHIKFNEKEFTVKREYETCINVKDDNILSCISLIKKLKNYDKILVIVNTIKTAKDLYCKLINDKSINKEIMLFHSQFTYEDRQKKSEKLESENTHNIIAICTQIVEVSLDINFDILITETAPPDALIQRFGRVNRYGKNKNSKIFIYNYMENSKYIYNKEYWDSILLKFESAPVTKSFARFNLYLLFK